MTSISTVTKMPLNDHMVQSILKIGQAMIFGKELGSQAYKVVTADPIIPISANRDSAQLIEWIAKDYQNNSALLESLVAEMAVKMLPVLHCGFNSSCTNFILDASVINGFAQKSFSDDMGDLVSSMFSASAHSISKSTMELAKQVADMDEGDVDVEEWAEKLAHDIGKGRD
jgi:hypothetical protein